jgi:hypothetical protein
MSPWYLRVASLVVVVVAAAGVAGLASMSVPPVSASMDWTRDDVTTYGRALEASRAARLLDPEGHAETVRLVARVEATPTSTTSDVEASPGYAGMRIQDHRGAASTARTFAIVTLAIALFAGVLAALRAFTGAPSRRSALVPIAVGLLVLAMLPGALLVWISSRLVGVGTEAFLLLASLALFLSRPRRASLTQAWLRATPSRIARLRPAGP